MSGRYWTDISILQNAGITLNSFLIILHRLDKNYLM